jgi:hypothetical protein
MDKSDEKLENQIDGVKTQTLDRGDTARHPPVMQRVAHGCARHDRRVHVAASVCDGFQWRRAYCVEVYLGVRVVVYLANHRAATTPHWG